MAMKRIWQQFTMTRSRITSLQRIKRKKAGVGSSADISELELRKMCQEFVEGYIDDQRNQFKRLGVIGEWDNPYITLTHDFEAEQIRIFAEMACKGYIYKGLKPVYWCPECKTALAEAEIEYSDDQCYSIYVKFKITDDKGICEKAGVDKDIAYSEAERVFCISSILRQ